jgi:excisionase family DNA binding protein
MASTVPPDTTSDTPTEALLLTVPSAAKRLAVSNRTIYTLFSAGKLRLVKIGRSTRIRQSDLRAYVASLGGEA